MSEFYALEFALCHKFGHREKFTEIRVSVRGYWDCAGYRHDKLIFYYKISSCLFLIKYYQRNLISHLFELFLHYSSFILRIFTFIWQYLQNGVFPAFIVLACNKIVRAKRADLWFQRGEFCSIIFAGKLT